MTSRHIAHIVDTYPLGQYKYIYDQIVDMEGKNAVVIAERFLGGASKKNFYYFRKFNSNLWLGKFDNLFTDKISFFSNLYMKSLARFYRDTLRNLNASLLHAHFGMVGYKLADIKEDLGYLG